MEFPLTTRTKMQGGFYCVKGSKKKVLFLAGMITIRRKRSWGEVMAGLANIIKQLRYTRSLDIMERHLVKN